MLDRLFSKALSLVINGEEISFHTLAEFEFALGGRTNVPASKLADLIVLSPTELKREAKSIKTVEKRFVDILSRSIAQPGEIGRLVREVDIQVFSNDYDWRSIFKALNHEDDSFDELRRVAVVKYMYTCAHGKMSSSRPTGSSSKKLSSRASLGANPGALCGHRSRTPRTRSERPASLIQCRWKRRPRRCRARP